MPPLHNFDDYDDCLGALPPALGTYCMVFAEIAPNDTSLLWQQISNFSSNHKRHYRHDHIFFGVCLERCQNLLQTFNHVYKDQLYGGKVQDNDLMAYYADVHKRETDERARYDHVINICLNYEFRREYNLTLRTSIEYCEVANIPLKYDLLDYIFYITMATLALSNVLSSLYDYKLKRKSPSHFQNNDFYMSAPQSKVDQFLTSFSICRNYYRITRPTISKTGRDLNFLNAFRCVGIFIVIFAHVLMLFMGIQIKNPQFFEKFYYRAETSIIQNGSTIIQIFFVMSGFFLNINFVEKQLITQTSKSHKCLNVYIKLLLYRYLRLVPSLCMLILFNATILTHLQDGPFWRHYTEAERVFCREYWWKNIFFINNYIMKKSCAHHTWYIAADTQLFELFSLVLIINTVFPNTKKIIFTFLFLLSIIVPALITYIMKFDAVYHLNPENYRYLYFKDTEIYYQTYPPFYTNIGGYLFGILSADIYIKAKKENLNLYKGVMKYELLWWLIFPAAFALLFLGAFFMSYDFPKPSVWVALYAGLYKNIWVMICCLAVLGMCFRLGWIAYEICNLSIFRPLARISYQSYIWHVVVLRLLGAFYRTPVYINRLSLISYVILGFTLTHMIAFVFAISLEFPIAAMLKIFEKCSKGGLIILHYLPFSLFTTHRKYSIRFK